MKRYPDVPGHVGRDTSIAAADSIEPVAGTLRRLVLDHIRSRGFQGATDWELERDLDLRHQTASARRRELELKGFVVDSGEQRLTDSGRKAIVWVLPKFRKEQAELGV